MHAETASGHTPTDYAGHATSSGWGNRYVYAKSAPFFNSNSLCS